MMTAAEIPAVLTGAGGTAAVMYLWLRSSLIGQEALEERLAASQERERDMAAKMLEAVILNKQFLENHQGEMAALTAAVERLTDEIAGRN